MLFCSTPAHAFEYEVFASVKDLPAQWDLFLPEGHRLKIPELSVVEQVALPELRHAYLTIWKDGELVGLANFQLLEIKSSHFQSVVWKNSFLQKMKEVIFCKPRHLLVCGNVFRNNGPGFYFRKTENEPLIFELIRDFDKHNPFKLRSFGLWVKEPPTSLPIDSGFRKTGGDLQMNMTIRTEWESFDDYLYSLSKKYQQRARKIRKSLEGVEVKTLSAEEMEVHSAAIGQLFGNILDQQSFHLSRLPGSYFLLLKQTLGDRFTMTGYFRECQLVAFSSYIVDSDNSLEIYYIGLDYVMNDQHKLYFNILFDGLEAAIEQKRKTLKLGRTGMDAKASLGAEAFEVAQLVRIKRGLPSIIFKYITAWYLDQEKPGWKERTPLLAAASKITLAESTL